MAVITGKAASIIVSGDTISGSGEVGMEATIDTGMERDKFTPVGTDIAEVLTGGKVVSGSVRAAWTSGGTLFQSLLDADTSFEVSIQKSAQVEVFASGCKIDNLSRRVAPGTDVMTEEITFTGSTWY